jgi:hypothetical protein
MSEQTLTESRKRRYRELKSGRQQSAGQVVLQTATYVALLGILQIFCGYIISEDDP